MNVRRIESIAPERWRNGGGVTRSIASHGDDWRVSLAEVERDGPYSRFDGIARISLVLRGDGVALQDGDDIVMLEPFEAVEYDGGANWNATLIGARITVLNVMRRTGVYRARVQAIVHPVIVEPGCAAIIVALDGACFCDDIAIGSGDVAVIENSLKPMRLEGTSGTLFLVTIERA